VAGLVSKEVYFPSEDSWLLEEGILKECLTGKVCLDLGCGSGIQGFAMLCRGARKVVFVDLNSNALRSAKENLKKYKTQNPGHFFSCTVFKKSNLFSALGKQKFDFVAFNPPYVLSDGVRWIDLDGGENGTDTINLFVSRVKKHLSPKGVVLILVSSLNNPKEIVKNLQRAGFEVKVVGKKKLFFEELLVLRFEAD
jgi:release factor glutamine methyltransferase